MPDLTNLRIAILATNGVEESELPEPRKALQAAGAKPEVISPQQGQIQAFHHDTKSSTIPVDKTVAQARPDDYDAVLLPGGALNADSMRMDPDVQSFIKRTFGAGKPFAVICHAPWELISADLARGRTMTSYHTIQDDVRNAGATWVDREVVVDGNLVTSRQPSDIPAFNREMINLFSLAAASPGR